MEDNENGEKLFFGHGFKKLLTEEKVKENLIEMYKADTGKDCSKDDCVGFDFRSIIKSIDAIAINIIIDSNVKELFDKLVEYKRKVIEIKIGETVQNIMISEGLDVGDKAVVTNDMTIFFNKELEESIKFVKQNIKN